MKTHRFFSFNVSALAILAIGCGTARLPQPDEVTWLRQSSQRLAKVASSDLRDRPERLQAVEYRYRELANSGNAYLSQVQAALDFETLMMDERRQHLQKMARIVASRYAEFVLEADAGRTSDAFVTVGAKVGGLVDGLVEELDILLEERPEESRKALRARLEAEKWKSWDRVNTSRSAKKAAASKESDVPEKSEEPARRPRPSPEAEPGVSCTSCRT